MENIMDNLKLAELKKDNMRKSFDQAHAQASSILLFLLQWKDLQDQFDLTKDSLLKQTQELALKEKKIVENTQVLEQRDQEVEMSRVNKGLDELQMKENQLGLFKKWVEERALELNSTEKRLSFARQEIDGCNGMLGMKREELGVVHKELEACNKELNVKNKQLGAVRKYLEEHTTELESKEMKLGLVNTKLEDCCKELSVKNEQLKVVQKALQVCSKELKTEEEQVEKAKVLVTGCNDELELKQKELCVVRILINDCSGELESKEKKLEMLGDLTEKCSGDLDSKKSKLNRIEESIDQCLKKLDLKTKELDAIQKMTNDCLKEYYLKEEELSKVQKLIEESSKDLDFKEKHLDSIKVLIEEHAEELEAKEKQYNAIKRSVAGCSARLSMKEEELKSIEQSIRKSKFQSEENELSLKDMELNRGHKLIEDCSKDLEAKEKHLDSVKVLIRKHTEELEAKEKEYDEIRRSVTVSSAQLTLKETELELIKQSISKNLSKLESEEKKLGSVQKYAKRVDKKLRLKEKTLYSIKKTSKRYCEDLELKEREFNAIRESIKERNEELQLTEKLLKSVQTSILEYGENLEAMKIEQFSVQKSIVECTEELESKNRNLDLVGKSLKECCDKLALKEAELDSVKKNTCDFKKELEEREKYLDTLKRTSEDRLDKLEMKERQLEERVKEFALKEQQLDSMQKSVEERCKQVEFKEKQLDSDFHSQTMIAQPENLMANNTVNSLTEGLRCCITISGRNLQLVLNEHLRKHDLIHHEVFTVIQKSPDPGKLILDAMQGFYRPCLKKGDMEFDLSVIRRSCTTLLEYLLKISPQIMPEIREEAMKLAHEWKSRIRAEPENSLEVLGFLQLLAAFKLASAFSSDELQSLLDTVSQYRQAPELREVLQIPENLPDTVSQLRPAPELGEALQVPGNPIFPSHIKLGRMEHLNDHDPVYSSSANCHSGATIDERSSPSVLDEYMGGHDLKPREILAALQMSPEPGKFVLEVMQVSYAQQLKNEGAERDDSIVRGKVLLLEQLMKVSPMISPLVKEEATKLAVSWKTNIRLNFENSMETWAFLLFSLIYGFVFYFGRDEIFRLLVIVAHHRQAPEICRILGFTTKIPVIIRHLIQRNLHIEAVRYSCAFGLVDTFPPEAILSQYVENILMDARISKNGEDSLKAQHKAIDKELGALRSVLECQAECNFESKFLTQNIKGRISELEKQKASSMCSSPAPDLVAQPQVHPRDKPSSAPSLQQQLYNRNLWERVQLQGNKKRHRIDVPVDRPYSSNVATQSTRK